MGDINKPEISIIIPIYNVEKYLSRCLGSVEKQTFKDFEVIMLLKNSVLKLMKKKSKSMY